MLRMPSAIRFSAVFSLAFWLQAQTAAHAELKIGIDLSTSGPAAAIGIASKSAIAMWPKQIAGQKITYIYLDDGSDPGTAVRNVRKFLSEEKVDLVLGPTTAPNALAVLPVVADGQTPMISLAASAAIVEPQDKQRYWAFKMAQNDTHMATLLVQHMLDQHVRNVAFIGFADAYGEGWWREFSQLAQLRRLNIVASERYVRTDTSVTAQILKIISSRPDAVMIAGAGTPAVLPQKALKERGYRGRIYQTHGVATPEFLKLGGADVEGTLFATGPAILAPQLPGDHPVRAVAQEFYKNYTGNYGKDTLTQFAADAWSAYLLLANALPAALKVAQPGSPEFRLALRNQLEQTRNLVTPQGVINMSPRDHVGLDQRSRVMATVQQGRFSYLAGN